MKKSKLLIGIALGDPAGIGTEVTLRAVAALQAERNDWTFFLAGSYPIAKQELERFNIHLMITKTNKPVDSANADSSVPFLDIPLIEGKRFKYGVPTASNALLASTAVRELVLLTKEGKLDCLACGPVNKQALLMANSDCVDHSTYIASQMNSNNYGQFFTSSRVSFMSVTGHITLSNIPLKVTVDHILKTLMLAADTYYRIRNHFPRIAVCSLDPHCGEGGLLGTIDKNIVQRAVEIAISKDYKVHGPISADAVFRPYILKEYDLIIGMYHDQIKIGIAALDSDLYVAFLAGVPIIRTTTTHGTAYDIAGKGIANPANMRRAIELAAELACTAQSKKCC